MSEGTEDGGARLSRRGVVTAAGSAGLAGTLAFWLGSQQADAAEPGPARDAPVNVVLPSSYEAGRDDIAPYVQRMLDDLEPQGRGSVLLPPGRHLWDSPCYLASEATDLTYELRGHGRGTVVELGRGLRDEFAVHLNEDAFGEQVVRFPRHPRLLISDMHVACADAGVGASLCRFRQTSIDVQRVRFRHVKHGAIGDGYTDLVGFRHIAWEQPHPDGRLYRMDGTGGDGLVMERITASVDAVVAELTGCNGGLISSCIGGRYIITDCDAVEMVGLHVEAHGELAPLARRPFVLIRSSRVTLRGGWDDVGPFAPAFVVEDTEGNGYSEVTWDGHAFGFRPDDPGKERAPDVLVRAARSGTRLRFRACAGRLLPIRRRDRWAVGPVLASDDPDVQAAMDAAPTAPMQDSELAFGADGWSFRSSLPEPAPSRTPSLSVRAGQTENFPGRHRAGRTLLYGVAAFDSYFAAPSSSGSPVAEVSVAVRRAEQAVQLDVAGVPGRALLRVWRGTRQGGYDSFVEIPVGAAETRLVDTGPLLCGLPWVRDGVPPPPPENAGAGPAGG